VCTKTVQKSRQNQHTIPYHTIPKKETHPNVLIQSQSSTQATGDGSHGTARHGATRRDTNIKHTSSMLCYVMLCNTTLRTEGDKTRHYIENIRSVR
jgi:hypothetical protein